MSTHTHDNLCDSGQPCAMCLEPVTDFVGIGYPCCPDCDNDDREQPPIPNFEDDWVRSTPLRRRLIERDDAYYFWLKGQQAGRIAEQVETRGWLAQVMAGYDERVSR